MNTINEATKVVSINSLPPLFETLPEYKDTHIWAGCRLRDDKGKFGNMFHIGKDYPEYGVQRATPADVTRLYEEQQLRYHIRFDREFREAVTALAGKTLVTTAYGIADALILAKYADGLSRAGISRW